MMTRKIIIACFITLSLALATTALSQLKQPNRFEEEVNFAARRFNVISMKNEGLALVRDLNKYSQGKKKWQLEIIDTTFSNIWSTELTLDRTLLLVGYEYNPAHLYLLFREGERDYYNFQLMTVIFYEKRIQLNQIKFDIHFRMTHFTMTGSSAVFGGYVNSKPAVLLYDLVGEQPKILPDQFINNVSLLDLRTNQNESFNVLFLEQENEKKKLQVRTYDHEGTFLMEDVIDVDPRYRILAGLTSTLKRDEMIIAGTYGGIQDRDALGFFSTIVDPDNEQPVTYTEFTSLEHSLDYLPPGKADKIKESTHQEKSLGSLPNYKAYVAPVRLEENSHGFYMLAELYDPPGNFNPNTYLNNSYNPINSSYILAFFPSGIGTRIGGGNSFRTIPDPYTTNKRPQVTMIQSIVVDFGPDGIPKRDVSLKLDAIRQGEPKQVSDFIIANEKVFLAFKKEDNVFYQNETSEPGETPQVQQTLIKLRDQNEELKKLDENVGEIRFWYDRHFFVWGYQKIRNPSSKVHQTRTVFYINRLTLQ